MNIIFKSDASTQNNGFQIEVTIIESDELDYSTCNDGVQIPSWAFCDFQFFCKDGRDETNCALDENFEVASITSPSFAFSNIDFKWVIVAKNGYYINLKFLHFYMANYLSFVIYGKWEETSELGMITVAGNEEFGENTFPTRYLLLHLRSNSQISSEYVSFILEIRIVPASNQEILKVCADGNLYPKDEFCNSIWYCTEGDDEALCPPIRLHQIVNIFSQCFPSLIRCEESNTRMSFKTTESLFLRITFLTFWISDINGDNLGITIGYGTIPLTSHNASNILQRLVGNIEASTTIVSPDNTLWIYEAVGHGGTDIVRFAAVIEAVGEPELTALPDCASYQQTVMLNTSHVRTEIKPHPTACMVTVIVHSNIAYSYMMLDIHDITGFMHSEEFISFGEGLDPDNSSSTILHEQDLHFGSNFNLYRVYTSSNGFWVRYERLFQNISNFNISVSVIAESGRCNQGDFACVDGRSCVKSSGFQNSYIDCPDGSDESPRYGFRDCISPNATFFAGSWTEDGCLDWSMLSGVRERHFPKNYCRALSTDSVWPHCLKRYTNDPKGFYTTPCQVPVCSVRSGCYIGNGSNYRETGSYTENGFACLMWKEIPFDVFNINSFVNSDEGFCRNPDDSYKPWCFFQSEDSVIAKESCQIPKCMSTDYLSKFRRYPRISADPTDKFTMNSNRVSPFAFFTVEDCAEMCLRDSQVPCVSFRFEESSHPRRQPDCVWFSTNPNSERNMEHFLLSPPDENFDFFIRTETECDPFKIDNLPEECSLPIAVPIRRHPNSSIKFANSLTNITTCWRREENSNKTFQITFPERYILTGMFIQACDGDRDGWVKQVEIQFAQNTGVFLDYFDRTTQSKTLTGNIQGYCPEFVKFDPPIYAIQLSISPVSWFRSINFKVDIIGCKDNDCDQSLGLSDKSLPDAAISASSALSKSHLPQFVRIQPFRSQRVISHGWIPDISMSSTHWIQVFMGNDVHTDIVRVDLPREIHTKAMRLTAIAWKNLPCLRFDFIGCKFQTCNNRLGMESGAIRVYQIKHKSYNICQTNFRLFRTTVVSVSAISQSVSSEVQIDLLEEHTITGFQTQGVISDNEQTFGEFFSLKYSRTPQDSSTWKDYTDIHGVKKIFDGNFDGYTPVLHKLERPFLATAIMITFWSPSFPEFPCLRLELYGCLLRNKGYICAENYEEIGGYCYGVIRKGTSDACSDIFHEYSHAAIIRSAAIQADVSNVFNGLEIPRVTHYLIGVTMANLTNNIIWNDRSPVIYDNFDENQSFRERRGECVYVSGRDSLKWQIYLCATQEISTATICQFDLDECLDGTNNCSNECTNIPGGYICSCPSGMFLDPENLHKCKPICALLGMLSMNNHFCFNFFDIERNWYFANETCSRSGWSLISYNQTTYIGQEMIKNKEIKTTWTSFKPNYQELATGICQSTKIENNAAKWQSVECNETNSFICISDLPSTLEMTRMDLSNVIDYHNMSSRIISSSAYITWNSVPPWYSQNTTWFLEITTLPDLFLRLHFLAIRLRKASTGTCIDSIKITEITNNDMHNNKGVYCGEFRMLEMQMHSSKATITLDIGSLTAEMPETLHFHSFYLGIDCTNSPCEKFCNSTEPITSSSGTFSSYNFPEILPPYYNCQWTVIAPNGSFLTLGFYDINIKCIKRYPLRLSFIKGSYPRKFTYTKTVNICGNAAGVIYSETRIARIEFQIGLDDTSLGFSAWFQRIDTPGCGVNPSTALTCPTLECNTASAFLASVNYPLLLPKNLDCRWMISVTPGKFIEFVLMHFNISSESSCTDNFLKVEENQNVINICNENLYTVTFPFLSKLNFLQLTLQTGFQPRGNGFLGKYSERSFQSATAIQISSDSDFTCPNGWKIFKGRCYLVMQSAENLNWLNAAWACNAIGNDSSLLIIHDKFEANFIHNLITEIGATEEPIYIGLRWLDIQRRYEWVDGSPLSYADWHSPLSDYISIQPDGGDLESCTVIILSSYKDTNNWHDVPCASIMSKHSVCQQSAKYALGFFVENRDEISLVMPEDSDGCGVQQFACETGECIHKLFVCDDHLDCEDGSDEISCERNIGQSDKETEVICSQNEYKCESGQCIPASFYCDFREHCFDGSDESDCVHPACVDGEFQCSNGKCIRKIKHCDLQFDCEDHTDEIDCSTSVGNFQCFSGKWLPSHAYCDGYRDCDGKNWEDEPPVCDYFGTQFACSLPGTLRCKNGVCVNDTNRCVFDRDKYGFMIGCRDATHLENCANFKCQPYFYTCPESYCIPLRYRCNGVNDCPHGDDEINCDLFKCPVGTYKCHGDAVPHCLPHNQLCDGILQCSESDDELFCEWNCPDGCSCLGLSFDCNTVKWSKSIASMIPTNVKQLFLQGATTSRGRVKREDSTLQLQTIEGNLFIKISTYPYLLTLNLAENGIEDLENDTFALSSNLRTLDLSYNSIFQLGPRSFFGLEALKTLYLTGNPVHTVLDHTFLPLLNLRHLDIKETQISSPQQDIFTGLENLQTLQTSRFFYCCLSELLSQENSPQCTPEADQFSSCSDLMKNQVLAISIWILGSAAVVGNFLVIAWRIYNKQLSGRGKRNPSQAILVTNLAIADLLMGIYMVIIASADVKFKNVYYQHSEDWQRSFFCKFAGFLSVIGSEASVVFLTVITLDRFHGVVFPLSMRRLRFKSTYTVAAFVWLMVGILSLIPALPLQYFGDSFYGRSSVCLALPLTSELLPGWLFSVFVFLIFNFICFTIMLICYVVIFIIARRSYKINSDSSEQLQMAARMAFLVGTDLVCWMPIIIIGTMALAGKLHVSGDVYAWIAVFVLPINSALNPYLYTFLTKSGRVRICESVIKSHKISQRTEHIPIIQKSFKPHGESAEEGLTEFMRTITGATRRHRLVAPSAYSSVCKYSLAFLQNQDTFHLTNDDKGDIANDLRKALKFLHHSGMTHAAICEKHVIIEESTHGNKRAFLLMKAIGIAAEGDKEVDKETSLLSSGSRDDLEAIQRDEDQLEKLIKQMFHR